MKMKKNKLKSIVLILIGILIALLISFVVWHQVSSADVLNDCKTLQTKMDEEIKKMTKEEIDIFDDLQFRIETEKSKNAYHAYIECLFDKAVEVLMGSNGADTDGIASANAANGPEWMKPESACLKEEKLVEVVKDSSPKNLLPYALEAYNKYVAHLKYLYALLGQHPTIDATTVHDFSALVGRQERLKMIVETEIQESIVALDSAFIALKEMRQAFVMHVHFQCMLKNLEMYRRMMANMRTIITTLPPIIEDASMHK